MYPPGKVVILRGDNQWFLWTGDINECASCKGECDWLHSEQQGELECLLKKMSSYKEDICITWPITKMSYPKQTDSQMESEGV